ncbi:MAG TPA: class I SAM-dependent methyltransferase [Candidatus Acidoferrales bacterium]|jgi:SAM-dependent methyltransferase|nr:class I SAM-dependent methyltransferase [Candidatus Acidoferrales bacterium]
MNISTPNKNKIASFLKSYGPSRIKKLLWDKEFSGGQWDFIDDTTGDCVYENLEKYARNGGILDLGCGPGNTANELNANAYQHYVGVDISEAALEKGRKRTIANGREGKNIFVQGDFVTYTPLEKFDVILFRESIYHVPMGKIKETLDRFSNYLKDGGVLIVRLFTADKDSGGKEKPRPMAMIQIMETEFNVIEKNRYEGERHPHVLILKTRRRG